MANLNPNRLTVLQGYSKLTPEQKMDALYFEVIKIKKRIQCLHEFQDLGLSQFINKIGEERKSASNSKYSHLLKKMVQLQQKHKQIKDELTIENRIVEFLLKKLYILGINKGELGEEIQNHVKEFKENR